MKRVFADTLYWITIIYPQDPWMEFAIDARRRLGVVGKTLQLGQGAVAHVRMLLDATDEMVLPHDRKRFLDGLYLYEARRDKIYSLVDCISMTVMRSMNIVDILTNDSHFS